MTALVAYRKHEHSIGIVSVDDQVWKAAYEKPPRTSTKLYTDLGVLFKERERVPHLSHEVPT